MKDHQPVDETIALTIPQFCRVVNISIATYYKLKRLGRGPCELRIPGTGVTRITPEARREWLARMAQGDVQAAAEREFERRSAIAAQAGRLAAASPNHRSRTRQRSRAPARRAAEHTNR